MKAEALYGFLVAFVVALVMTPLVARLARRVGAVDAMKERGLAADATPPARRPGDLRRGPDRGRAVPTDQRPDARPALRGPRLITFIGAIDDVRRPLAGRQARRPGRGPR
jgi:UDP-GlcNAc:undecaprenyl-phosphate GlcNAc-1-phosphate transferase